jgi:hypothetical protein
MFAIETGDLRTMRRGRKGALLLLAVVVLWTAAPLGACLLASQPSGQHSCCRGMELKCGISGTSIDGSCCRVHQQNTPATPVPPYSLEYSQKLAFVPHQASLQLSATSVSGFQNTLEEPPPKFPPGSNSILRI